MKQLKENGNDKARPEKTKRLVCVTVEFPTTIEEPTNDVVGTIWLRNEASQVLLTSRI